MKLKLLILISTLLTLNSVAHASGDIEAGRAKSTVCMGCHGVGGNSTNPEWPIIASQHASYIAKQLHAFKAGTERKNALMSPIAATLSEQDINDLAAFFAAQPVTAQTAGDPSKTAAGEQLYRGGDATTGVPACLACHGPNGHGNPAAAYPAIGGQHAAQIALQLRAYKKAERTTDQNEMMRMVAAKLSDEQIDAVAAYVQGLR